MPDPWPTNSLYVGDPGDTATYASYAAVAESTPKKVALRTTSAADNSEIQDAAAAYASQSGIAVNVRTDTSSRPPVLSTCTSSKVIDGTNMELSCDSPLRGGPVIRTNFTQGGTNTTGFCSGGFLVRSVSDNKPYLLTSGHCAPKDPDSWGGSFYTEQTSDAGLSTTIGPWHSGVVNDADGDGGIISVSNPTGWQFGSPYVFVGNSSSPSKDTTRNGEYIIKSQGVWGDLIEGGSWLCKTGSTSWTDCGVYDGSKDTLITGDGYSYHTTLQDVSTMADCQGDSGGPVYVTNQAFGLVTAGGETSQRTVETPDGDLLTTSCGPDTWVMALPRLLSALNVRLVTSSNP